MGGPHETRSIHRIWTEGGKTHIKVAKLDLSVLQIQAHDQNHPHKAMSETNCCKMHRCHPTRWTEITGLLGLGILICSCYQHKSLSYAPFLTKVSQEILNFPSLFYSCVDSLTDKVKADSQQDIYHLHQLFSFFSCMCPVRPF